MEEICGLQIPSSTDDDNSEDNNNYYHLDHPLMMMMMLNNGEKEKEDQYYAHNEAYSNNNNNNDFVIRSSPWLPTSPYCASVLSATATATAAEADYDDNDCNSVNKTDESISSSSNNGDIIRAKISSHPLYPNLLQAYINFLKVGAPPEMANRLDEIVQETVRKTTGLSSSYSSCLGQDPELDEFMETYSAVLGKYKLDLEKPYKEATAFLSNMESQLTNLCNKEATPAMTTLGDELEVGSGGVCCVDDEIKEKLLKKYGGYISSLRHDYFSKKKTNGKLPSNATNILQNWWTIHYNWPYPTEADKVALAETTGLDQKQINNWFINQRKRHWKTSRDHNCFPRS